MKPQRFIRTLTKQERQDIENLFRNPCLLTRGFENKGADHPRWLPFRITYE